MEKLTEKDLQRFLWAAVYENGGKILIPDSILQNFLTDDCCLEFYSDSIAGGIIIKAFLKEKKGVS